MLLMKLRDKDYRYATFKQQLSQRQAEHDAACSYVLCNIRAEQHRNRIAHPYNPRFCIALNKSSAVPHLPRYQYLVRGILASNAR